MDPKKAQEMASRVKKMGKGGGIGAGVLAVAGAAVYGLSKSFYTGKSKCMQKGHWFASDITPPPCSVTYYFRLRTVNTLDFSSHPVIPLSTVIFPVSVLSKFYTSTSVFLGSP